MCNAILLISDVRPVYAEGETPKVVTTDLQRRQKVDKDKLIASFVIYDDGIVSKVLINGQAQKFEPADTVVLTKEFTFLHGRNLIEVLVEDDKGNEEEFLYLVAYGEGVELEPEEKPASSKQKIETNFVFGLKYEMDDNPTSDIGSPVKIGDIDLQGVVKDSEQPDMKRSANAIAIMNYGKFNAAVGASVGDYAKEENKPIDSMVIFANLCGEYGTFESGWLWNYMFLDFNLGEADYSQNHSFSVGYKQGDRSDEAGSKKNVYSLSYTHKEFAASSAKAGGQQNIGWEHSRRDAENMDSFRSVISVGNNYEGYEESQFDSLNLDMDWNNKWQQGALFDIGFGLQYRSYKNEQPLSVDTPLGDTRVDVPLRLSTALGWEIKQGWNIKYNYSYLLNLSNKSPYVRQLHGLALQGSF